MKIEKSTPELAALQELGRRLSEIRKQQGFSQEKLAEEAGLGVATLRRIEDGSDSQLSSWLKLVKALGMTAAFDGLLPESFNSPMFETLGQKQSRRQRQTEETQVVWGDEKL